MLIYNDAKQLLDTARNKDNGKPIARNTRLFDRGGYIAVRLHSTDIIEIYPDGEYRLFTGGWYTLTTKRKINQYSPVFIYQRNHEWFFNHGEITVLFEEGIKIHVDKDQYISVFIKNPQYPVGMYITY